MIPNSVGICKQFVRCHVKLQQHSEKQGHGPWMFPLPPADDVFVMNPRRQQQRLRWLCFRERSGTHGGNAMLCDLYKYVWQLTGLRLTVNSNCCLTLRTLQARLFLHPLRGLRVLFRSEDDRNKFIHLTISAFSREETAPIRKNLNKYTELPKRSHVGSDNCVSLCIVHRRSAPSPQTCRCGGLHPPVPVHLPLRLHS